MKGKISPTIPIILRQDRNVLVVEPLSILISIDLRSQMTLLFLSVKYHNENGP